MELRGLPGEYAPPDGRLVLAFSETNVAGCVALKKLADGISEMKRMYVRPQFRGKAIGRGLAHAAIEEARKIGYSRIRLETLPSMKEARSLYESLGFRPVELYRPDPASTIIFLELALR